MNQEIRTILLIDPSASTLFHLGMHLSLLFKRLNYQLEIAKSGEEAVLKMEEKAPWAVVSEVVLPDMTGIDLLKSMKGNPRLKAVPFVIATAENDAGMQVQCMRLGSAAYLFKPVEPETLYRTLQAVSETIPRSNIRLPTTLKVIVGDGTAIGGAERTECATAISVGGIYVHTLYPQPLNALTPLRIFLPDRGVTAKAMVLYSYTTGTPDQEPGMGMKFVQISDEGRTAIRNFIRDRLTQGIAEPGT